MKHRQFLACLILVGLASSHAPGAYAGLVTYDITGRVNATGANPPIPPELPADLTSFTELVDLPMTGWITLNTDAQDQLPQVDVVGRYTNNIESFALSFGRYSFLFDSRQAGASSVTEVGNSSQDNIFMTARIPGVVLADPALANYRASLVLFIAGANTDVLSSDSIPQDFTTLAGNWVADVQLGTEQRGLIVSIQAQNASITRRAVPEPSAFSLMALATCCAFGIARRRRLSSEAS
jgi:hypothetical protein